MVELTDFHLTSVCLLDFLCSRFSSNLNSFHPFFLLDSVHFRTRLESICQDFKCRSTQILIVISKNCNGDEQKKCQYGDDDENNDEYDIRLTSKMLVVLKNIFFFEKKIFKREKCLKLKERKHRIERKTRKRKTELVSVVVLLFSLLK